MTLECASWITLGIIPLTTWKRCETKHLIIKWSTTWGRANWSTLCLVYSIPEIHSEFGFNTFAFLWDCCSHEAKIIGISRRWGWARHLPGEWPDGGPWGTDGKWTQRRTALKLNLTWDCIFYLNLEAAGSNPDAVFTFLVLLRSTFLQGYSLKAVSLALWCIRDAFTMLTSSPLCIDYYLCYRRWTEVVFTRLSVCLSVSTISQLWTDSDDIW